MEKKVKRDIPNSCEIELFLHCALCLEQKPEDVSPREWASLEVGWTKLGIQVWCKRHECNVIHIDFEGCQHLANLSKREGGVQ
jgi:hypothetical protein